MVLLTSSQVSGVLSAGIVAVFTLLLFLSGYVLQQQTLHSLQVAIKPIIPTPKPQLPNEPAIPVNPNSRAARHFGGHGIHQQQILEQEQEEAVNWKRLAHVQFVKDHMEVCSAIMVFAELHKLKSPSRRVLLFPKTWLATRTTDKVYDGELETSKRLLRMAARRYSVLLHPIEPFADTSDAHLPSSYSLGSIFALTEFDRILYLQTPGLVLDSLPLDSLLAFAPKRSVAALPTNNERTELDTSMLLVVPSVENYAILRTRKTQKPVSDVALFRDSFPAPSSLLSPSTLEDYPDFFSSTSLLHSLPTKAEFNTSSYLSSTAYIHINDDSLPGPQYDVHWGEKIKARPENHDAQIMWERIYESFRNKRMDVCGLDLETWNPFTLG